MADYLHMKSQLKSIPGRKEGRKKDGRRGFIAFGYVMAIFLYTTSQLRQDQMAFWLGFTIPEMKQHWIHTLVQYHASII